MKKNRIWGGAAVALSLALLTQVVWTEQHQQARAHSALEQAAAEAAPDDGAAVLSAVWRFQPKSFAEARGRAKDIVLAEVVSTKQGDDLVASVPGMPNDEDRVPTQRVTLKVVKSYKGGPKKDETLTLFQTGGDTKAVGTLPVPAGRGVAEQATDKKDGGVDPMGLGPAQRGGQAVQRFFLEGDPEYKAGERYLLLLEDGPSAGLAQVVSPEGRYRVQGNGKLESTDPHPDKAASREVHGKALNEIERELGGPRP